jgi:hypothetical protein
MLNSASELRVFELVLSGLLLELWQVSVPSLRNDLIRYLLIPNLIQQHD